MLSAILLVLLGSGFVMAALAARPADGAPLPAASATFTVDSTIDYLGDPGRNFTFAFTNTGSAPITDVEVTTQAGSFIPLPGVFTVIGCPTPPTGWTTTFTAQRCRWTAPAGANALAPGQSKPYVVRVKANGGNLDESDTFSGAVNGRPAGSGVDITAYSWEVTDVIVNTGAAPAVNGPCPAQRRSAPKAVRVGMVVCGINHTGGTASVGSSTLGGTFVAPPPGTYTSGEISPSASAKVLGNWSNVSLDQTAGLKTVTAKVSSVYFFVINSVATSPTLTLSGYTTNRPPVAVDDGPYTLNEDGSLILADPGIKANDSDPDSDPITVKLPVDVVPAHGTLTQSAAGGFTYTPTANFNGSDSFKYRVNDGSSDSNQATVTFTINPISDPPTNLSLSPSVIAENLASGTTVGDLSTTDVDLPTDTHTYSLVDTATFPDNAKFTISDNQLKSNALFDFEAKSSYSIKVQTTDAGANNFAAPLTVTVSNVAEAPTSVAPTGVSTNEDAALAFAGGNALSVADSDGGNLTVTLTATNGTLTMSTLTGLSFTTGDGTADSTMTFSGSIAALNTALGALSFAPTADYNGAASLSFTTSDGVSPTVVKSVTITIAPVVDITADTIATNEDTPVTFNAVTGTNGAAADSFEGTPSVTSVTQGTIGTVTFAAGGVITYTPGANQNGTDSFTYTVTSGGVTETATVTMTIAAVNDAPTATNLSTPEGYTEGQPLNLVNIVTNDVDNANLTAKLTLSDLAAGALSTATSGSTTSTFVSGVWTASGPIADVNTLLAGVTFTPAANYDASFTIATSVSDGIAAPLTGSKLITGTGVNDAPTSGAPTGVSTNEDSPRVFTGGNALTVADSDGGNLTVTLSATNGALTMSTLTGLSFTSGDGTADSAMTFSGSIAAINTALASLSFSATPDYNGAALLSFTTSDGVAAAVVKSVSITISPVVDINGDTIVTSEDTPIAFNAVTGTNGATADSFEGTPSVTSVTQGTLGSVSFAAGGVITYTPVANQSGSDSFTYTVTSGGVTETATVTMTVSAVNDAPTATNLSTGESYTEDQSLNLVNIVTNDVDNPNLTATLTLSNPAVGALSAAVAGSTTSTYVAGTGVWTASGPIAEVNTLLAGVTFTPVANFNANFTMATSVSDGIAAPITGTKAINGISVNDVPVANPDTYGVAAGSVTVAAPGVLGNDTDQDAGATRTAVLDVGPASATSFNLASNGSFTYTTSLTTGADSFTYYAVDNNGASSNIATVTLTFNQPPVAVNDGPVTTNEDTAVSINLSSNDTDADGPNSALTAVNIVQGAGGTAALEAGNRSVLFTPNADFNGATSFTYKAFDGSTNSTNSATVSITVNPVNDAPVLGAIEGATQIYTEQAMTPVQVTNTLTVADVDSANIASADVRISAGFGVGDELVFNTQNGITGSYATGTGILTLSGSSTKGNYETALRSITFRNLSNEDPTNPVAARTVTFTVNDGGTNSNTQSRAVTVSGVNDRPVVTLDTGNVTYIENGPAVVVSPGLTLADPDNANLTFAQVDISTDPGYVNGQDSFTWGALPSGVTCNPTVGCFNAAAGVVQFSGSATKAQYETLLRTVAYQNSADNFTTASPTRTIIFRVGDGTTNSVNTSRAVAITPVNDAPALGAIEGTAAAYTEQAAAVQVTNTVSVTDPDDTNIESGVVDISAGFVAGDELVFSSPQNGIAGSYAPGTGILTLSGSSTKANYQTALRSIEFRNLTSDNPGASRTIRFKVNDGTVDSNLATRTITVTEVNDPPVNTVPPTQTGTEDVAVILSSANGTAFSVTDPEAATLRVALTAANATITLATTSNITINTGANGSEAVTFTGTQAAVNAAMDGLTFLGTPNYNVGHAFDTNLSIVSSDEGQTGTGGAKTDTDVTTINLAAVNDAPVAVAKSLTVQANMGLNDVPNMLVGVTDPDSGDPGYTPGITLTSVTPVDCAGCTISDIQSAAGTFDLDVGVGLTGAHTLQYTVTDNASPVGPALTSAPATINLTINGPVIWFVNDNAAAGGDGSMSAPFQALSGTAGADNDAADVDAAGDGIFVFEGSYSTGLTLNADEHLIGQGLTGTSFDAAFGINPPSNTPARPALALTRPAVSNQVSLGGNNGVVRGLNLTPASGTGGITASGRTGMDVSQVSISAANAAAVSFTNSAGTASFTEIDATGGTSAIVWTNSTVQNGALTVTGTGTADCTTAANCTGGAIQSTTGPGINVSNLNNNDSVTLNSMLVQNSGDDGLRLATVKGVDLNNLFINNNGDAAGEDSIDVVNMSGMGSLTASTLDEGGDNNLSMDMSTGTLTFSVTGNVIRDTEDSNGAQGDGLAIDLTGDGNLTLNVTGPNTFADSEGDHIQLSYGAANTSTVVANITGNTFTNDDGGGALGSGLTLGGSGSANTTYNVSNNTITGAVAQSINLFVGVATTSQVMRATVDNNIIGNASPNSGGSTGITLSGLTQAEIYAAITNNTIQSWNNPAGAIDLIVNDTCGGGGGPCPPGQNVNLTVTGNTVFGGGPFATHGMRLEAGGTNDTVAVCADIGGAGALKNNIQGREDLGGTDIRVRSGTGSTIRMPGYTGAATSDTDVTSYLTGRNTITSVSVGTTTGVGFFNTSPAGSACVLP